MAEEKIIVTCGQRILEYPKGTTLREISQALQSDYKEDIILARVDGKLRELFKRVNKNVTVEMITVGDLSGHKTYKRTATLILAKAVEDVMGKGAGVIVEYSVHKGYYCVLVGPVPCSPQLLQQIQARMVELVEEDLTIIKKSVSTGEAVELFKVHHMYDKEKLFRYRRSSKVNIYNLDGYIDYNYGYMAPSTGYIKHFQLYPYDEGFVMQMPTLEAPHTLEPFKPSHKLFNTLKESNRWGEMLNVATVGCLNDLITKGGISELMLVQEALQEAKLSEIAETIASDPKKRIILIAGPSSSGKTTFSHRLSIQLRVHGLTPHPIPVDDYFVNREDTPKDEKGNYNYECLEALDVHQFNEDMIALLHGERVQLPTYNFITGKREYKGKYKQIGPKDVLVIEGIHGLNDALTYSLHKDAKFKIYISALTQLNVDEHNRIPTTDGRLIRRMVRDAAKRGTSAAKTIAMWPSVRRGEEDNIFPFQEEADVMFNSALIYELAVLKQYAEPLLFGIQKGEPEYEEAKRLLKFLDYFLGVSSESVPKNSLLREFIGGSYFNV